MAITKNIFGRHTTKAKPEKFIFQNKLDRRLAEIRRYNEEHNTHLSYGKYDQHIFWEKQKQK